MWIVNPLGTVTRMWHISSVNGDKPPTFLFTCCWCWHSTIAINTEHLLQFAKIRSEIFDCPIKEGPHYDLARTICMLYSTEFEWGSNQLYSLSRQLIGMWSDAHPAEVVPWLLGKLTHTCTQAREASFLAAVPSFICVQTHSPLHIRQRRSVCVMHADVLN